MSWNFQGWVTTTGTSTSASYSPNFVVITAPPPPPPPPRRIRPPGLTEAEALMILGLDDCATPEDVRRAYRAKAREAHPDAGGSHDVFLRVQAAMDRLREIGRAA